MIIINDSNSSTYSMCARRMLHPGQVSADIDAGGLYDALSRVVRDCSGICLRLSSDERRLLDTLMALDKRGAEFKPVKRENQKDILLKKIIEQEKVVKEEKIASLVKAREREEAIRNEANYTSAEDVAAAAEKSGARRGVVAPKKLDPAEGKQVSLKDLMGDNAFIETSMRHSGVPTTMASEEGWDMNKMEESMSARNDGNAETEKYSSTSDTVGYAESDVGHGEDKSSQPGDETSEPVEPDRKTEKTKSRRGRRGTR